MKDGLILFTTSFPSHIGLPVRSIFLCWDDEIMAFSILDQVAPFLMSVSLSVCVCGPGADVIHDGIDRFYFGHPDKFVVTYKIDAGEELLAPFVCSPEEIDYDQSSAIDLVIALGKRSEEGLYAFLKAKSFLDRTIIVGDSEIRGRDRMALS